MVKVDGAVVELYKALWVVGKIVGEISIEGKEQEQDFVYNHVCRSRPVGFNQDELSWKG